MCYLKDGNSHIIKKKCLYPALLVLLIRGKYVHLLYFRLIQIKHNVIMPLSVHAKLLMKTDQHYPVCLHYGSFRPTPV